MSGRTVKRDFFRVLYFIQDGVMCLNPKVWGANTRDDVFDIMTSPAWADAWDKWHLRYKKDPKGKDYWNSIDETLANKHCDCDDYAGINIAGLKHNGFNVQLLAMYGYNGSERSGHATCLVDLGDTYVTVGTFNRINHFTHNVKSVAQKWYDPLESFSLYELVSVDPWEYNRTDRVVVTDMPEYFQKLPNDFNPEFHSFLKSMKKIDKDFEKLYKKSKKELGI